MELAGPGPRFALTSDPAKQAGPGGASREGQQMDENTTEGAITEGVGKLKDAAGGLTGDTGLQGEGKVD